MKELVLSLCSKNMHKFIIICGEETPKETDLGTRKHMYEERPRELTLFGRRSMMQEEWRRLSTSRSFPGRQVFWLAPGSEAGAHRNSLAK